MLVICTALAMLILCAVALFWRHSPRDRSFWKRPEEDSTLAGSFRRIHGGAPMEMPAREHLQSALRESENRHGDLFDEISDWIYTHDLEGRIITVNRAVSDTLGCSSDELVGRSIADFLTPKGREVFFHEYLPQVQSRGWFTGTVHVVDRKGARRYLEIKSSLVNESSGGTYVRGTGHDITELKHYERELRKAREAAESAGRAKREFLAGMSHEMRTPLSAIIGFTQLNLAAQFGPLTPLQEESLGNVLRCAKQLLSLINDLLALSRMESGKLHLDLGVFSLRDTLERSLLTVKDQAHKRQVGLSANIGDIPERVVGDERMLKQVLFSLLDNGIKFTPPHGKVCLRAESGDGLLHLSVEDNGNGIRKEDLERVFEPFTQVDGSYSRQHSGAGIGLSMARELVELHGGRIWAESEGEGRGTTFRVVLPAALPPVSAKTG